MTVTMVIFSKNRKTIFPIVPAISQRRISLPNDDHTYESVWAPCQILDYDEKRRVFEIAWKDEEKKFVGRLNLCILRKANADHDVTVLTKTDNSVFLNTSASVLEFKKELSFVKNLLLIEEKALTSMMVLECLARAWVVPSPDNVLSSILKKMPKIQLRAGDRTIPLLIEEVNHRFMRVNIICMLQKRWKDLNLIRSSEKMIKIETFTDSLSD